MTRGFSAEGVFAYPDRSKGKLNLPLYVSIPIGGIRVYDDLPNWDIDAAIVSVKAGTLDVWLGNRGPDIPAVPQFHYLSGQGCQWLPLPGYSGVITVANTGIVALVACITLVGY